MYNLIFFLYRSISQSNKIFDRFTSYLKPLQKIFFMIVVSRYFNSRTTFVVQSRKNNSRRFQNWYNNVKVKFTLSPNWKYTTLHHKHAKYDIETSHIKLIRKSINYFTCEILLANIHSYEMTRWRIIFLSELIFVKTWFAVFLMKCF